MSDKGISLWRHVDGAWRIGQSSTFCLVDWQLSDNRRTLTFTPTARVVWWQGLALLVSILALTCLWMELGPPWTSMSAWNQRKHKPLNPDWQTQRDEAQRAMHEYIERNKNGRTAEFAKRTQLERQQKQELSRAKHQQLGNVIAVLRQVILWPVSVLFLWIGGWFGLVGMLSFPFDRLTIRRAAEAGDDVLVIRRRSLFRTRERRYSLASFDQLSWDVRRSSGRSSGTTWIGVLLSRLGTQHDLKFALYYQSGRSPDYNCPPIAIQNFLESMKRLTGLPIQNPQIQVTSGFFTSRITRRRRRTADFASLEELPSELRRQAHQLLSEPRSGKVRRVRKFEIEVQDADGQLRRYHSLDELPENLRRQLERRDEQS